ncbi:MAG: hypothetical protein K2M55_00020 [Muribaculaceae bacterium]|nr:hypothetical protein [Muribaculaceae bacterium]
MKKFTSAMAVLLSSVAAMAVVPLEQQAGQDLNPQFSKSPMKSMHRASSSDNVNSFFEGFEGRNPDAYGMAANTWLPSGWSQFSRAGNKHMGSGDGYWDITWLTLSNETTGILPASNQTTSYEGESFAYIMADVMWGDKKPYPDLGLDYATNHPQDEWLVTPAFSPKAEEWFYFQLEFRPGWSLYNRVADDFTGETTLLEVYVTEGNGTTDSEWKKLWSLKDYINKNYTQEQLRADLYTVDTDGYKSIYVNVGDYVGKKIKMAFRYFGVNGQGMALDNVSLGIPMPKPSYTIPTGFFSQQTLSPLMEEITGTPQLLIPFDTEATWKNTSKDILTNEWAYAGADGSALTSEAYDLVTPAYTFGEHYTAPVLTGSFESRSATFSTPFTDMQAGGRLHGTGVGGYNGPMGIASYNYLDPKGTLAQNSNQIAFHKDMNEQWELITGRMPGTIEIQGLGSVYPATERAYGFDYVDVFAQIVGSNGKNLNDATTLVCLVYRLPEDEANPDAEVIGGSILSGKDINALPDLTPGSNYKNLRFKFDVPVTADGNILVLFTPYYVADGDKIVLPFMKSEDDEVWGNSVAYVYLWDSEDSGGWYDTFYNMNSFPIAQGHFAGLTMSLGAVYSYMTVEDGSTDLLELPTAGGELSLDIRSSIAPEEWAVTTDRVNRAPWITMKAVADEADAELYHVNLTFDPNDASEDRDETVYIAQPGAYVALNVKQAAGLANAVAGAQMTVKTAAGTITVSGVEGKVAVYNATGVKVAEQVANGTVEFSGLAAGVYIVRAADNAVKVVL